MQLEKLYQKILKNVTFKKKVKNHSEPVAASFTCDDHFVQDDDRGTTIQWAAGARRRQQSRGRVLSKHIPVWKKTTQVRKSKSRNLDCWKCNSPNYRSNQCSKSLLPEVRVPLEGKIQFTLGEKIRLTSSSNKRNF